jgi:hypothetical protein
MSPKDMDARFDEFLRTSRQHNDFDNLPLEQQRELFHEWIEPTEEHTQKLLIDRFESKPCGVFRERQSLYESFLTYRPVMEEVKKRNVAILPKIGEYLEDKDVILAIAAVIEAIDLHQQPSDSDRDGLRKGGFTVVNSTNLERGKSAISERNDTSIVASRPRRCWLMPFTVDLDLMDELTKYEGGLFEAGVAKESGKMDFVMSETMTMASKASTSADWPRPTRHAFLVVVQEESTSAESEDTTFNVYFLDTLPEYFQNARDFLFHRVKKAARDLKWTSHRNYDEHNVQFSEDYHMVRTSRQAGGFECGYFTILHAWTLAMGLTPDPDFSTVGRERMLKFIGDVQDLIELAITGMLDWKTLVSSLFCKKFARRIPVEDILESRRFQQTVLQDDNETGLGERLQTYIDQDEDLADRTEDEVPYNRDNNINFSRATITRVRPKYHSNISNRDIDNIATEFRRKRGLERTYEDLDDWLGVMQNEGDNSMVGEDILAFLDDY